MENNYILQPFLKENPVSQLSEKDMNIFLLKFGTLISLINNKNINPTFLFLTIIKDEKLQNIFKQISGANTTNEILRIILNIYPNLLKSKIVKENSIRIIKNKKIKEKRSKHGNK